MAVSSVPRCSSRRVSSGGVSPGSPMGTRAALMNLALVTQERGDLARAITLAREALDLCDELADTSAGMVRCVEIAAALLAVLGRWELAVRLVASAAAQRAGIAAPVPAREQVELERMLSTARFSLAADAFPIAWQEGARVAIDDAADLAAVSLTRARPLLEKL